MDAAPKVPEYHTLIISLGDCEERLQADLLVLAAERQAAGKPPLSIAELATLWNRREDVGRAYSGDDADAAGAQSGLLPREAQFGAVTLYSITMAGSLALTVARDERWPLDKYWADVLTAYVLANGRDEDAMRAIGTYEQAMPVLREFAPACTGTTEELVAAINALGRGARPSESADGTAGAKKKPITPACSSRSPTGTTAAAPQPGTGSMTSPTVTRTGCSKPSAGASARKRARSPRPPARPSPRIPTAP